MTSLLSPSSSVADQSLPHGRQHFGASNHVANKKLLREESKENINPSSSNFNNNNRNTHLSKNARVRSSTTIIPTATSGSTILLQHAQSMNNLDTSSTQQTSDDKKQSVQRPNTSSTRRAKSIGVKDKIALFDLYAPSLTPSDKVLKTNTNEEMISLTTPMNVPSSSYSKFFLKKFPILKHQVDPKNVKGGGFIAPSPRTLESVTDKMLTPITREEQQIFNQPIVTTVVEPSAAFDVLPRSVQAPFAKDGMHTKLHIPQLPLDTLDMLRPDSFGNSLNSVRVNWIKSDDITERSISLTSRADSVLLERQPLTSRAASAGTGRRYQPVKQGGSKSLPSTSQRKRRSESPSSQVEQEEEDIEEEYEMEEGHFLKDSDLSQYEHNVESIFKTSESENEIYDSLKSSYYLNVKDEKNKRKGKDHISIEEHVKITNDLIFKITSSFKEKVRKIEQSVKKEFENLTKHHSKRINHIEEKRSNSIVKEFIRDVTIRKQNQKLKEQMAEMKKRYDEAMELLSEMNSYKQKYENSRREFEKYYNDRPSKRAENTITTIMAENDKMTLKEKQDVMSDFLKHFYNEDGTLNEKAIFDMFVVNKELHENLSRTRDTVSFLRDQLYEKQKAGGAANQKAQIPFFDASLIKSQQEKQVMQGLSQAQFDEPYQPPQPPDPNVVYELRQRNEYLKKCYEVLSQKVILADRVALRIKTLYEGVEKYTKCTSCKEPTLKPKILCCGHAFCVKCCNSDRIKRLDEATNSYHYHCSECRDITEELIDNKNLNELISFTNEIDIEISELEKSIQDALSMTKLDPTKKSSLATVLSPRPNSGITTDSIK